MLWSRRYRHLRRYRQIVEVLLRHGFGWFVENVDLLHLAPFRRRGPADDHEPRTRGARMRAAMEELGPTFIKLGQLLSSRPDFVPADIINELSLLQDRVPPVPAEAVTAAVEAELQRPLADVFASFDPEPLGAASIGQVHRATLPGGADVVVKVRRPGIEDVIEVDLDILASLADLADERWPSGRVSFAEVVAEFSRTLRREMDYRLEAANTERFRRLFADDPRVVIPRIYSELSTSRLLVMEHIDGVKINDLERLRALGVDTAQLARLGAEVFLRQVLIEGVFHGDPHPGNLFVLEDGRLGVIDFGIVGRLDERTMESVADLFIGVTQRDAERMIGGLVRLGALDDDADMPALKRDLEDMLDRHLGKPLKDLAMGVIVNDVLHVAHMHKLRLPPDLLLLGKALVTIEGLGQQLDPEFNALEAGRPFAEELIRRRLHPAAAAGRFARDAGDLLETLLGLPEKVQRTLNRLNRGEVRVRVQLETLDRTVGRLERGYNRIAMAVMFAALFIGAAILWSGSPGPVLWGVPVLPALAFFAAFVTGAVLLVGVLRSGPL
ncbi:MAG: ABC transporter [Bacillota bacterium]|nr:MAG: ABC transporter [Bacillota bacterium]